MKTNIQIFEEVARHLLNQKAKSRGRMDDGLSESCLYLTDNGMKCAIGCLINPEVYDKRIEGTSPIFQIIHGGWKSNKQKLLSDILTKSDIPHDEETYRLLNSLQSIHDNSEVSQWWRELIVLHSSFFGIEQEESKKFVEGLL